MNVICVILYLLAVSLSFRSTCLFTLHQTRRRKTLPCLPIMSESSWPSEFVLVCLHKCFWSVSDCLDLLVLDVRNTLRHLPHRALQLPLTDLSFDDHEISLSQGPLRIYDYSSLLEFNLLVCRLGWVEGDWIDWLTEWRVGAPAKTFGNWRWRNADTYWWQGQKYTQGDRSQSRMIWFDQFKLDEERFDVV